MSVGRKALANKETNLKRIALTILATALGVCALYAQMPAAPPSGGQAAAAPGGNPLVAEAKQAYNQIKANITGMADKMPAEAYDFKATPDVRTFGATIAHIADTQMRTCAGIMGEQKSVDAASKTAKADLVAALKTSFDECDAAFNATNDSNAQMVTGGGRMQRSRLGSLIQMVVMHDNEEYGYLSVYMRLNKLVPPSSDRGGMMGGQGRGMGGGRQQ
jgi:uncharacterized damage-inducible protein DinB